MLIRHLSTHFGGVCQDLLQIFELDHWFSKFFVPLASQPFLRHIARKPFLTVRELFSLAGDCPPQICFKFYWCYHICPSCANCTFGVIPNSLPQYRLVPFPLMESSRDWILGPLTFRCVKHSEFTFVKNIRLEEDLVTACGHLLSPPHLGTLCSPLDSLCFSFRGSIDILLDFRALYSTLSFSESIFFPILL